MEAFCFQVNYKQAGDTLTAVHVPIHSKDIANTINEACVANKFKLESLKLPSTSYCIPHDSLLWEVEASSERKGMKSWMGGKRFVPSSAMILSVPNAFDLPNLKDTF